MLVVAETVLLARHVGGTHRQHPALLLISLPCWLRYSEPSARSLYLPPLRSVLLYHVYCYCYLYFVYRYFFCILLIKPIILTVLFYFIF